jgi:hypothetical protein
MKLLATKMLKRNKRIRPQIPQMNTDFLTTKTTKKHEVFFDTPAFFCEKKAAGATQGFADLIN